MNLVPIHLSRRKEVKLVAKKKEPTALQKAKKKVATLKEQQQEVKKAIDHALGKSNGYWIIAQEGPKNKRPHARMMKKKWDRTLSANRNKLKKINKAYEKANDQYKRLKGYQDNKKAVANKIAEHMKSHQNEGNCAIYRTDGHSANVIYISPNTGESESSSVNITSYSVDEGSPRSNYARTSSETKSVSGLVTGKDRAEANSKYKQLEYWRDHHTDLTYEGDFKQSHLLIAELGQNFTDLRDNLQVTLTFQHVRAAEITTSTGNNSKTKKSKSTKTTAGSRNKRYTAITIKPGDTLLGLSRKYGRSVAWLQKVNHIKNPNKIYAGRSLYVSEKQKKINKKVRVK